MNSATPVIEGGSTPLTSTRGSWLPCCCSRSASSWPCSPGEQHAVTRCSEALLGDLPHRLLVVNDEQRLRATDAAVLELLDRSERHRHVVLELEDVADILGLGDRVLVAVIGGDHDLYL